MSLLRDEAALMGRLQIDFAKQFAQVPAPLTPDPPPVSTDASAAPLSEGGESDFPFANELSRDEE